MAPCTTAQHAWRKHTRRVLLVVPRVYGTTFQATVSSWRAHCQLAESIHLRTLDAERTTHELSQPITGEQVRFTNVKQEWPIGEFSAYYVHPGEEPAGIAVLRYSFTSKGDLDNPSLTSLVTFIHGRFSADERATMIAMPASTNDKIFLMDLMVPLL